MRKHCGNCANHKKETNQFSEECGKCVLARLENGETTDPSHWREKPKTNADRIRAMSDEELDMFLRKCEYQTYNGGSIARDKDYRVIPIKEWLKQPAEGE